MRAEVDLADVVVLQDGGVSGVGSVVGSTMVQGAAGGESQAGVQPVLLDQLTRTVLQPLAGEIKWEDLKTANRGNKPRVQCSGILFILAQSHIRVDNNSDEMDRSDGGRLTRFQSWSVRVSWSRGRAGGPVCGPRLPVWSRSTPPRWLYPSPASPRGSYATPHCDWWEKKEEVATFLLLASRRERRFWSSYRLKMLISSVEAAVRVNMWSLQAVTGFTSWLIVWPPTPDHTKRVHLHRGIHHSKQPCSNRLNNHSRLDLF